MMIQITNITKNYGDNLGNFNINLNLEPGQCYGLIGPNGAGKTTLIRQILGFIKPDAGSIEIFGYDAWKQRAAIMDFTGYVAGEISLYNNLSGLKYLKLKSQMISSVDWNYVANLSKHFDINLKMKIKKMSKGTKQKVAIIAAVMHKPKFLVFDEPTSGLDPFMQNQFKKLINKIKQEDQATVIICSHILDEVVDLSDKIGFLKKGSIVEEQSIKKSDLKKLKQKLDQLFESEVFI